MKSRVKKVAPALDKESEKIAVSTEKSKEVLPGSSVRKPILVWGVVALIAVVGMGSGIYYYLQYQNTQKLLKDPVLGTRIEAEKTVEKVAEMVELPAEQPTVATVSDVTKLSKQSFFARAKNGDKVLIYKHAKKAILYRPSTKKIVEFGPINLGTQQATASPSATTTLKPVKVAIYNGTKAPGLAVAAESQLKVKASHVTVVAKGNAVKRDYTKTVVADVTGANSAEAQSIAQLLKGSVGTLPAGEKATSSAEIVVIIGR